MTCFSQQPLFKSINKKQKNQNTHCLTVISKVQEKKEKKYFPMSRPDTLNRETHHHVCVCHFCCCRLILLYWYVGKKKKKKERA